MLNAFNTILERITVSNLFYWLILLLIVGVIGSALILILVNCPWYESLIICLAFFSKCKMY